MRHPFTRAISEYAWQAKWTKYWRQCTADNLNEFVQRVFVEGIDPDDEPAPDAAPHPERPHVPPAQADRLASITDASQLGSMDDPPSEMDCHAMPQWVGWFEMPDGGRCFPGRYGPQSTARAAWWSAAVAGARLRPLQS